MSDEATKILQMLEAVNDDTAVEVLDEIDCHMWCYLEGVEFVRFIPSMNHDKAANMFLRTPKYCGYEHKFEDDYEIIELAHDNYPIFYGTPDEYEKNTWGYIVLKDGWAIANKVDQYTRSRDALKAIRPDGYTFTMSKEFHVRDIHNPSKGKDIKWFCLMASVDRLTSPSFSSVPVSMPTEEIAEAHAIIQAIDWKRENE